jgi:hypothetical protein
MWAIIGPIEKVQNNYRVLCRCECGFEGYVRLIRGEPRSQKCRACRNGSIHKSKTNGVITTKLKSYSVWEGIIQRCLNPKNKSYKNYGARGITVSEEWKTFSAFFEDMGERPDGKELDRIDNERGYAKGNCRWVTRHENNRNHRGNVMVTIGGTKFCLLDACKILGLNYRSVCYLRKRKRKHMEVEEAILDLISRGLSSVAHLNGGYT